MTMEQNLNAKYQKNKTKAQNNITTTLKCEDVVKHQDDEIGNLFVVFLGWQFTMNDKRREKQESINLLPH